MNLLCLMHLTGSVACWNNRNDDFIQIPESLLDNFTQVSTGFKHQCSLRSVNFLSCVGSNTHDHLSIPSD